MVICLFREVTFERVFWVLGVRRGLRDLDFRED